MTVRRHILGDSNFDGDLPKKLKAPQFSNFQTLQTDMFSAEKNISTSAILEECRNINNLVYNAC